MEERNGGTVAPLYNRSRPKGKNRTQTEIANRKNQISDQMRKTGINANEDWGFGECGNFTCVNYQ